MKVRDARWERVGTAARARIEELRLTSAEVQRRSGISDKTLTGYLNGEPIRRPDKARGLCEALGWRPDSIELLLAGAEAVIVEADDHVDDRLEVIERRLSSLEDRLEATDDRLEQILRLLEGGAR